LTGAVLALVGAGVGGGESGGGTLGALAWANIFGVGGGSNEALTITGITSPHTLTATITGTGLLYYTLNGATLAPYAGGIACADSATLGWTIINPSTSRASGTITINDASDAGALVDSFSYSCSGSGVGGDE